AEQDRISRNLAMAHYHRVNCHNIQIGPTRHGVQIGMKNHVKVSIAQLNSTSDEASNVRRAIDMIREAANKGADLVALPELFHCLADFEQVLAASQPIPGPLTDQLAALARELKITLCAGSIAEACEDPNRVFNTSLILDARGEIIATYRKMHLFEVDLPDRITLCEADYMTAGDNLSVVSTDVGVIGQAICYDLRFPRLHRQLTIDGAEMIIIPSAFTMPTGRDHWKVLAQARAIENQVYLIAPNQVGKHNVQLESYGHSLVIDPWGNILAEASETSEELILADLDAEKLTATRARIPVLKNRRL
ncbi:MAG: carbon-nitrogen hydrolase family protein, partial [Planctomycetota bacterium]